MLVTFCFGKKEWNWAALGLLYSEQAATEPCNRYICSLPAWTVKMLLFSVKYLLSISFLRFKVLLLNFEHSKSAMRFTAFSTAHVDPHGLYGLMKILTSLRLVFILESEYQAMLVTPTTILQLFKIQNSKISFLKGCKYLCGHFLVVSWHRGLDSASLSWERTLYFHPRADLWVAPGLLPGIPNQWP